jgi:hypothetical protein
LGALGFEPRTSALSGLRSNQLSYAPGIISDLGIRIPELTDRLNDFPAVPPVQSEIRNPKSEMPSIANSPAGFPQPGCGVFIFCRVTRELSSVSGNT